MAVISLDRFTISPAIRRRFFALATRRQTARQWGAVEAERTDDGLEYFAVWLLGGEDPAFTWFRSPRDGRYVVTGREGETIAQGMSEAGLFSWLEAV